MSDWTKDDDGTASMTIGSAVLRVLRKPDSSDGLGWVISAILGHADGETLENVQASAERALLRLRDDLNDRFAPVLKWKGGDGEIVGQLVDSSGKPVGIPGRRWTAQASRHGFVVRFAGKQIVCDGMLNGGVETNRQLAEKALRSCSVKFRMESDR